LHLALLHGEQFLVGFLFAAVIVIVGFPVLMYFWLWRSTISESKLALTYFVVVAVLCLLFSITPNNPTSIPSFIAYSISFILTLPWSALAGFVIGEMLEARGSTLGDRLFALVIVICAGVNAVILYFIALKMRRLIK
jgi:hypothetical protein